MTETSTLAIIDDASLDVRGGTFATTAAQKLAIVQGVGADTDIGAHNLRAATFTSDVTTGTAPFTVTSTTTVANLKAATVATIAGLAPNTATTQATQGNITSLGTLTNINTSGHITASGNISASGNIYSYNEQYYSTTARLDVDDNTTNYFGPNAQGINYYYWNRDLGTSSTTITSKTTTLNSGIKIPHKIILTGYHLNIQARTTDDDMSFTLVYCDGMWDGNVTSTSQTLVEAEGAQTVSITTANNFYELDRRDQFAIPLNAMSMIYPRFKKTAATGGTGYDIQLAIQYRIVK